MLFLFFPHFLTSHHQHQNQFSVTNFIYATLAILASEKKCVWWNSIGKIIMNYCHVFNLKAGFSLSFWFKGADNLKSIILLNCSLKCDEGDENDEEEEEKRLGRKENSNRSLRLT